MENSGGKGFLWCSYTLVLACEKVITFFNVHMGNTSIDMWEKETLGAIGFSGQDCDEGESEEWEIIYV